MVDRLVGDTVSLAAEGNHFVLKLSSSKKRWILSRHGVHVLLAQCTTALHDVGPDEADVIYVPFIDMRR